MKRPRNEDVIELHQDVLGALLTVCAISWLLVLVGSLIYYDIAGRSWFAWPLSVLLVAILTAVIVAKQQRPTAAAWALIVGYLASPTLLVLNDGVTLGALLLLLLPVLISSLLLPVAGVWRVTLLALATMLVSTVLRSGGSDTSSLMQDLAVLLFPALVCLFVGSMLYVNGLSIEALVEWAISSQRKDARRAELFRQQQEALQQANLALERSNRELEHANAQLHTLNGQLHEARRIAENANQLKTRFLANVSHELRTPLQIIIGLADTSLDMPELQKANPQLCQNVQHIQQSGMHLSRLIDDLLDLSRAEINALDLYPETLDVHGLLTNSFQSLRDSYNTSRAVGWHVALPERLPLIQADPVRLRQIVFNLLSNAARYTERGAITLGATVEPPFLHIWVADTGSGIALDQQERIFEPFASDHSRGRPRGVGLGLSITRRLVALHEGLLTLESRPGHGSTFHVYMPLPDLQGKPARAPDAAEPVLLLIGGQALLAPEIRALAGQQRLPLRRPRSLSELQTLLEAAQPVGILWDLAHPSADDGQMMALLRANPRFSTLPLLVFGQAQGDVPDLAMGVTEFVIKPISEATLQQSLQNISIEPPTVDRPLLIVDDDQQARSSYRALLAHMYPQHTIVEAVDGRMALNLLEQLCPSLIILDLVMPQVDGFDVLDAIRANPAIRHIPVMVLSGRLLSPADVQRLRHPQVVFQTKTLLSEPELTAQVERSLTGEGQLALGTSIFVKQAIAYMHQHYQRSFARRDIAAAVGINERYLTDIFHQELGLSPWEYLSRFRMVQAKALLRSSEATIEAIAAQVGFEDASYFRRAFRKIEGMSPSAYRERARWSVAAMDGIPGSG